MKCRNCRHLYKDWCAHKLDSPDPDLDRECKDYMQATYADRIRASSDEQLALFCKELMFNDFKPACKKSTFFSAEHKPECEEDCVSCILKLLQQPAEEDT